MIAPNVENAVTAEKIQIRLVIHVMQVCALRARIHLVEPDYSLRSHQRWVHVLFVQLVIFAQSRRDNFLQIKRHPSNVLRIRFERKFCSDFAARLALVTDGATARAKKPQDRETLRLKGPNYVRL